MVRTSARCDGQPSFCPLKSAPAAPTDSTRCARRGALGRPRPACLSVWLHLPASSPLGTRQRQSCIRAGQPQPSSKYSVSQVSKQRALFRYLFSPRLRTLSLPPLPRVPTSVFAVPVPRHGEATTDIPTRQHIKKEDSKKHSLSPPLCYLRSRFPPSAAVWSIPH